MAGGVVVGVSLASVATVALAGRNASGTYSLPNSPFVSGTVISSSTMNSNFSDVTSALTDSLDRTGKGSMSAQLKLYDGVVATPGLGFANETGTGFYRAGAGDIRFAISGTDSMKMGTAAGGPLARNFSSYTYMSATQNTTGSYANVTGMSFAVAANGVYEFELVIAGSCTAGTGTFVFTFTGPAAPTSFLLGGDILLTGALGGAVSGINALGNDLATFSGSQSGLARIRGILVNGANSGTMQLQTKSSGTLTGTVGIGSFMRYHRLDSF